MRVFLIRHGAPETAWGAADDPGLSAEGRRQAAAAAASLAARGPLRIVSSPMLRCRETAEPYAALMSGAAATEPRVSEVATPQGIADRRAWLAQTFPWAHGAISSTWPALDPLLWAWRADVLAAVRSWREDCAVFTHFIAINTIVGAALGRVETIVCRPGYASVTELAIEDGRLRLIALGAEIDAGDVR